MSKKKETKIGVMNGAIATDTLSLIPCTIGYSYIRFQISGDVRSCCIAKHPIGNLEVGSWRMIWRSEAYQAFRSKMLRINKDRFHLTDPEFLFCQQCSHLPKNLENAAALGYGQPKKK